MKLISFGLSILLFLLISVPPAEDADSVFAKLGARSYAVQEMFKEADEKGRLARAIYVSVGELVNRWKDSANPNVPEPYLRSLMFDIKLLDYTLADRNRAEVVEHLQYVKDDLSLKIAHARQVVGAGSSLGASVRVTVKTIRGDQGVNGYLVRCNPRRYADLTTPMFVFNNETNPTTVSSMPPGNYEMWVEMPAGTKIRSKPVTIGGDGALTAFITFEVP